MRSCAVCWLLFFGIGVSVVFARQPDGRSPGPARNERGQESSTSQAPAKPTSEPGPEMRKLIGAFSGTWSITSNYEPSAGMPNGSIGRGEEVYRPGPGGRSLIEYVHLKGSTRESTGLGLVWWDEKAQGYRAVW